MWVENKEVITVKAKATNELSKKNFSQKSVKNYFNLLNTSYCDAREKWNNLFWFLGKFLIAKLSMPWLWQAIGLIKTRNILNQN
jgi:hypothetical protein